ncbi:MAG: tetratricopeptide repeat protein [Myxococcales bacterium]|nr:tetratricopeptide repeat protein [Myxococcales bacterium]
MQEEARARDVRIEQLEEQSRINHAQLDDKVAELETVLEKATRVLHRDSAELVAQVDSMSSKIASLEGALAELRHEFETFAREEAEKRAAIEQRLSGGSGGIVPPPASEIPADKKAHFDKAYQLFLTKDYAGSRALFKAFVDRYRSDQQAGNAQYWIAASYLQEGKPATALGEYRKVISNYAKSGAVNVALYGMGDAFHRLHACTDARAALQALLKRKPKPDLAKRARALIKKIRKEKKGCTS